MVKPEGCKPPNRRVGSPACAYTKPYNLGTWARVFGLGFRIQGHLELIPFHEGSGIQMERFSRAACSPFLLSLLSWLVIVVTVFFSLLICYGHQSCQCASL